jgi:hypothetical protein
VQNCSKPLPFLAQRLHLVHDRLSYLRMARDNWVEILRCPHCGKIGTAQLSTADDHSWTVQVDSIPNGFQFIQCEDGSNFYCASCDCAAEP